MASVDDSNPTSSAASRRRSMHQFLGGSLIADVLLWRRRNTAIAVLAGFTSAWILFELAGYSLFSLVANALCLLVAILFFWARAASLLNRPLPPLPNLEISEEVAGKVAVEVRVWINQALAIARDIAIGRDKKVFLQVILVLWMVSTIGGLVNFFTFVYIGVLLALTVPVLYDKYQDRVDEKLGVAHKVLLKQYDAILIKTGRKSSKEKKTQ
ncbi:Reticulon domain-containing protein [Dioscorea alata]|uniref:Reticulon domain-containing protein n=2 Tax=Dioscorea alata TaxID=55571 RepID=A0ACB7VET7_DIOAL|nr:Reticulon domain-containing protein [Dioscorea alata]KAH7672274.1 Reticulon domain-containing protein [Dioscorea alata]